MRLIRRLCFLHLRPLLVRRAVLRLLLFFLVVFFCHIRLNIRILGLRAVTAFLQAFDNFITRTKGHNAALIHQDHFIDH